MLKKSLLLFALCITMLLGVPAFAANGEPSSWAVEGLSQMLDNDLVPVDLQSNYQAPITRGEFARLLIPTIESLVFTDTQSEFFFGIYKEPFDDTDEENIMKAYSNYIINGVGDNKFNPNGLITREQVAIMMVNAVDKIDMLSYASKVPFVNDDKDVSTWAKAYVYAALNNGLVSGTGNGNYSPKGKVTREQAILMVNNIIDNYFEGDGIDAYKRLIDKKFFSSLAPTKSEMTWRMLGSKPLTVDLMSLLGQDLEKVRGILGTSDFEGNCDFDGIDIVGNKVITYDDGSTFTADSRISIFNVYGIEIYHIDNIVIGFDYTNSANFKGKIGNFNVTTRYDDLIAVGNVKEYTQDNKNYVDIIKEPFHATYRFGTQKENSEGLNILDYSLFDIK